MRLYADTGEARAWVGVLCENHVLFSDHQGTMPRGDNGRRTSTADVALPERSRIGRLIHQIIRRRAR
jgi:hypothetical protein